MKYAVLLIIIAMTVFGAASASAFVFHGGVVGYIDNFLATDGGVLLTTDSGEQLLAQ